MVESSQVIAGLKPLNFLGIQKLMLIFVHREHSISLKVEVVAPGENRRRKGKGEDLESEAREEKDGLKAEDYKRKD